MASTLTITLTVRVGGVPMSAIELAFHALASLVLTLVAPSHCATRQHKAAMG